MGEVEQLGRLGFLWPLTQMDKEHDAIGTEGPKADSGGKRAEGGEWFGPLGTQF